VPANPYCTDPTCSLANTRVLLTREPAYERDGRTERLSCEFRLCERCHMGFVHPVPDPDVLSCFYTGGYAYYQAAGDHPSAEAGSRKVRLARLRYLPLTAPGLLNRLRTIPARLAELLARKTITFTLGIPLTLPVGARILDYGYGTGSWLQTMRLLGYAHLAGYDIAANTERARELEAQGIEVIASPDLPGRDGSFDCIRLEHVFEHLTDPLGVLRTLHGSLRPGGFLVMTFPTIYPWMRIKNLAASPYLDYLQLPIHLAHHSVESATRLLRAAGFHTIHRRITRRERFLTVLAQKGFNP
jgi:SAM-dependent methyltransferase